MIIVTFDCHVGKDPQKILFVQRLCLSVAWMNVSDDLCQSLHFGLSFFIHFVDIGLLTGVFKFDSKQGRWEKCIESCV